MTWVAAAAIVGGATLAGSYMQSKAAKDAAGAYSQSAQAGIDQQRQMFDTLNTQGAPFRGLGYSAINQIGAKLPGQQPMYNEKSEFTGYQTGTDYLTKPFTAADLNNYLSPNYAFQLEQGLNQARSGLNAAGGLVGGNAMRGLQEYAQGFAGNAFSDAVKNYYLGQQSVGGNLTNLANIGLGGQGQSVSAGTSTAGNISNLLSSIGNAQAQGIMGSANAWSSGLNNLSNYAMLYAMKSPGGGGAGAGGAGGGSDIRLKENIKQIGQLPNGLNVYSFEYKPEFKNHPACGHGKFVGVMAQEVEKVIPDAVFELDNGYKAVHYDMIH